MQNRVWAPNNKPANVKIPTVKDAGVSILGCISNADIIDISKRNPAVFWSFLVELSVAFENII